MFLVFYEIVCFCVVIENEVVRLDGGVIDLFLIYIILLILLFVEFDLVNVIVGFFFLICGKIFFIWIIYFWFFLIFFIRLFVLLFEKNVWSFGCFSFIFLVIILWMSVFRVFLVSVKFFWWFDMISVLVFCLLRILILNVFSFFCIVVKLFFWYFFKYIFVFFDE